MCAALARFPDTSRVNAPASASSPATPAPKTHLVTRLRIVERPKETHVLQISDADTTLNVPLNDDQLNNFTRGILTALGRAGWNLILKGDEGWLGVWQANSPLCKPMA